MLTKLLRFLLKIKPFWTHSGGGGGGRHNFIFVSSDLGPEAGSGPNLGFLPAHISFKTSTWVRKAG